MVTAGLDIEDPDISLLLFDNRDCLRLPEHLPCPGPEYRYYEVRQVQCPWIVWHGAHHFGTAPLVLLPAASSSVAVTKPARCHCAKRQLTAPHPSFPQPAQMTRVGVYSMMQQFISRLYALAENETVVPIGLEDPYFDFIYNGTFVIDL